jgi:predicted O-methyltransferase YrrM
MQSNNLKNILAQAIKPSRFSVMFKKVIKRMFDPSGRHNPDENLAWLESNSSSFKDLAIRLDAELWKEAGVVSQSMSEHAAKVLENVEYKLGGWGAYPILYFIARYMQPDCIVETGVAAGYSSYAFLSAIRANNKGTLYSSDFPYFRIPNPERYIGIVVEESLKEHWHLLLDGDEANLPRILEMVEEVDLFHYDSDKSYSGRKFALTTISPSLNPQGIILMDDIQDNSFFYDYVEETRPNSWYVFNFQKKFVGMIGRLPPARL